jgi:hypothetical protein
LSIPAGADSHSHLSCSGVTPTRLDLFSHKPLTDTASRTNNGQIEEGALRRSWQVLDRTGTPTVNSSGMIIQMNGVRLYSPKARSRSDSRTVTPALEALNFGGPTQPIDSPQSPLVVDRFYWDNLLSRETTLAREKTRYNSRPVR